MDSDRSILIGNLVTIPEICSYLEVHWNTIYLWRKERGKTNFPQPIRKVGRNELYDYAEVYGWFQGWAAANPGVYKFNGEEVVA